MRQGKPLRRVTMTEARVHFHELARTIVETGEPVLLTRYGRVMARMGPCSGEPAPQDQPNREDATGASR